MCIRDRDVTLLDEPVSQQGAALPAPRTPKVPEATKTTGEIPEEEKKQQHMQRIAEEDRKSRAEEEKAKKEKAIHEEAIKAADEHWRKVADKKDWDSVVADMDVYKFSGQAVVTEDPRRKDEYRNKVVDELGFGPKSNRTDMTAEDRAAVADVLRMKAAAFWLDGSPRTVLRHLMHDTIPTGPPVRTPPHHLKGEEAQWVDEQLQSEVESGQLERGNSEWASPPFATKEFAAHKRQRKRRVVVDYRRVNARTLRTIYHVRNADCLTIIHI